MADYLVVNLPADTDQPARWVVVDSNGTLKGAVATGTLDDAAKAAAELPVIVLVPGSEVLTLAVDLPVKAGARLRAALPYAVEDQLATDIEGLHFASGKHRESGLLPAAVVARTTLEEWLERLHAAGLRPAQLVPEYHGVQRMPNTVSLVASGSAVMLNDGGDLEFMFEDLSPAEALALAGVLEPPAGEDDGTSPRHLVAWCDAAEQERFAHDWTALRAELASVDVNVMPDGAFPRLAATVAAGAGINLLQGPYGKRTEVAALLRPWRVAAGLLVAVFVLGLVGKGVDYLRLERQQAALQEQYIALYQALQPGDSRIPADPIGAADSIMRQLVGNNVNSSDVFLPSLMQLADAISRNREADVEAVSYRAGVIDVRLTAPDVSTLDKIQKMVSESGRFTASIQGTTRDPDGKVNSRIQIREAGA